MGIFDIFGTGDQTAAANAQIAGLTAGNSQATSNINQGIGAINSGYTAALQPYLANYNTATAGTTQLGNVLGLNGPTASNTAQQYLQSTPGYQFQKNAGEGAINAQAAANGTNASGNQALALSNYDTGLAGTTYNNYVSQLQPYLGASNAAAGGIAGVNTGQAGALANQYGTLANLDYNTQTGIGNANANKDLAGLTASGNLWNALGSFGGAALNFAGGGGGGLSNIFSSMFSGGGAGGGDGKLSDRRAKQDIEKVGELHDGLPVYKYRYIGDNVFQIGLMAQDVEKVNPDAVGEWSGFKTVDYGKATEYAAELSKFLEAA